MQKAQLFFGIICFALAVIIFAFAGGLRRIYSGVFFLIIGLIMVVNARRKA
jgi:hypothetical protein